MSSTQNRPRKCHSHRAATQLHPCTAWHAHATYPKPGDMPPKCCLTALYAAPSSSVQGPPDTFALSTVVTPELKRPTCTGPAILLTAHLQVAAEGFESACLLRPGRLLPCLARVASSAVRHCAAAIHCGGLHHLLSRPFKASILLSTGPQLCCSGPSFPTPCPPLAAHLVPAVVPHTQGQGPCRHAAHGTAPAAQATCTPQSPPGTCLHRPLPSSQARLPPPYCTMQPICTHLSAYVHTGC